MRRIEQARRPSANVNRVHHRIRKLLRQRHPSRGIKLLMPRHLRANTPHIRRKPRRQHHPRMEIAVGAPRLTKRHLHINPQRFHQANSSTLLLAPASCRRLPVGAQHCCAPVGPGAKIPLPHNLHFPASAKPAFSSLRISAFSASLRYLFLSFFSPFLFSLSSLPSFSQVLSLSF